MNQQQDAGTATTPGMTDFSPEQIAKLEALRASYPLIELVDDAGMQQLRFLRWLHRQGQCPAG